MYIREQCRAKREECGVASTPTQLVAEDRLISQVGSENNVFQQGSAERESDSAYIGDGPSHRGDGSLKKWSEPCQRNVTTNAKLGLAKAAAVRVRRVLEINNISGSTSFKGIGISKGDEGDGPYSGA